MRVESLLVSELAARDRSLITVAALVVGGDADQLRFHLGRSKENGVTEAELIEVITHLAFYAGWPKAMTAIMTAKQVFRPEPPREEPSRLVPCGKPAERLPARRQGTPP